jgi:hypothetical protein
VGRGVVGEVDAGWVLFAVGLELCAHAGEGLLGGDEVGLELVLLDLDVLVLLSLAFP